VQVIEHRAEATAEAVLRQGDAISVTLADDFGAAAISVSDCTFTPPPSPATLFDGACAYTATGLSVMPIGADKRPATPALPCNELNKRTWKLFQEMIADPDQVRAMFGPDCHPAVRGMAIVTGQVSGNLTVIDFDTLEDGSTLFECWRRRLEQVAPGLLNRLPIVQSPSGGWHVYVRCSTCAGNQKLAGSAKRQVTVVDETTGEPQTQWRMDTWIETRGEGGYVVAPPTPRYALFQGALTAIPEISPEEYALLLTIAREFDESAPDPLPVPEHHRMEAHGTRPGDIYNQTATLEEIQALLLRKMGPAPRQAAGAGESVT
jgi:hypothetical protein